MASQIKIPDKPLVILNKPVILYQPNRVTFCRCASLTLMESRVFTVLIKELQCYIVSNMQTDGQQFAKDIMKIRREGFAAINLSLKDICKPRQYKDVYAAIISLGEQLIQFDKPTNVVTEKLFSHVTTPTKIKGYTNVRIQMSLLVFKSLIITDKNNQSKPINYTKYLLEVPLKCRNKYAFKLYMILASWKSKKYFRITFHTLKNLLGISNETYVSYKEFKRRILIPIQEELKKLADCWYDCTEHGFEEFTENRNINLYFKLYIREESETVAAYKNHIQYLLKTYFGFTEKNLVQLETFFLTLNNKKSYEKALQKLHNIQKAILKYRGTDKEVINIIAYVNEAVKK